jgi:[histone H3]-trimethyl-L-lysine9/36 demethylase
MLLASSQAGQNGKDQGSRVPTENDSNSECHSTVNQRSSLLGEGQNLDKSVNSVPRPSTLLSSSPAHIPHDTVDGIIRLHPESMEQCRDFPVLIDCARQLGADNVGVFKFVFPQDMSKLCEFFDMEYDRVSFYKSHPQKDRTIYIARHEGPSVIKMDCSAVKEVDIDEHIRQFEHRLRRPSELRDVRYCTDIDARTPRQRKKIGLPEESPIWPAKGDQLERTKYIIPGLHRPYGYKSGPEPGAPFVCHIEDCNLPSINALYSSKKIWIVVAPHDATRLETKFQAASHHKKTCAQAVRHFSRYIPRSELESWEVSYKVFSQVVNEVVFVFPEAYHQGFSTGSTLAEAMNYAPLGWSISGYRECSAKCPHSIPNAKLEFLSNSEEQQEEEKEEEEEEEKEKEEEGEEREEKEGEEQEVEKKELEKIREEKGQQQQTEKMERKRPLAQIENLPKKRPKIGQQDERKSHKQTSDRDVTRTYLSSM